MIFIIRQSVTVTFFFNSRYSGAICGLAYVYTLPPIIHMLERKKNGKLTWTSIIVHSCIISIGILNFIGQIVISV